MILNNQQTVAFFSHIDDARVCFFELKENHGRIDRFGRDRSQDEFANMNAINYETN